MGDPYYLDLEAFSLERLRRRFETEEMLPGRQILKEDTEERFAVLADQGLSNLSQLISALKTRKKTEAFAAKSGLPLDYLIILRREALSYMPKFVYFRDIPGVDPEVVDRLAAAGILHSKHLFDRGRTREQRAALGEATGLPAETLLEMVKLADLARLLGLGPAFVRLLYEAGADTIENLSQWDPVELDQAARAANREKRITRVVPGMHDLSSYVAKAGELAKAVEYD
jgi:predicted flap endonuclease-1-like 5' DNA nuclease